jgi:hypothetical protein
LHGKSLKHFIALNGMETKMNSNYFAVALVLFALTLTGCSNGTTSINPIETKLGPNVITLAMSQTKVIDPENCNDWTSPSWQKPDDWWNSLNASQKPRFGNYAIAGFDLLHDTNANCSKARQDLYRAGISFDLSQSQNLRGLVTKATMNFSSDVLPSGVKPNSLCQAVTGGGGSLIVLAPSAIMPTAFQRFAYLGSFAAAAPFPTGSRIFAIPQPWIAGNIGNKASTSPTGSGTATFTVDVTDLVNSALNWQAPTLAFMLGGSDETALTVVPPAAQDCKTIYNFGELVIQHY